jgi:hypothetical protein
MHFYLTQDPDLRIYAAGGEVVKWSSVDGVVGWFKSSNPGTIKSIGNCIATKTGGRIREVTEAEYEAAVKKVRGPILQRDRESVTAQGYNPAVVPLPERQPLVAAPAAVAEDKVAPAEAGPVATPPKPNLRRRGKP